MRHQRRGLALALCLLVLAVIVSLGFGLSIVGINHLNSSELDLKSKQIEYVAEAGAANAIQQLKADPAFSNPAGYVVSVGSQNATVFVLQNNGSANITCPQDGARIPPNVNYIFVTATMDDHRVSRKTGIMCRSNSTTGMFQYGIFGGTGISFQGGGNGVLAEDSYASSNTTGYSTGGNNGKFGANTGVVDPGNFDFHGGLDLGPAIPPATGATYTGTPGQIAGGAPQAMATPYPTPPVIRPAGTEDVTGTVANLAPGAYHDLTGTVTIKQGGDYVFNDVSGTIIIDPSIVNSGDVRIFIEGTSFTSLKDVVNNAPNNQARYCQIYCAPSVTSIVTQGASGAGGNQQCFALYAPGADVTINGNHEIFGSIIAKSYTKNGNPVGFHYDTSLANLANPNPALQILSWQRF